MFYPKGFKQKLTCFANTPILRKNEELTRLKELHPKEQVLYKIYFE